MNVMNFMQKMHEKNAFSWIKKLVYNMADKPQIDRNQSGIVTTSTIAAYFIFCCASSA